MPVAASAVPDLSARRDLGVAWMNHGHAQLMLGNATGFATALFAYEQAIAVLRMLPLEQHPAWANSLGAAWMNHGQLLHRVHGLARVTDALASFDAAAAVLRPVSLAEHPWARRNLAGTQLNRANLLLDLGRFGEAATVAREALDLCRPHEHADSVDADLVLKARRAACDALGQLLAAPGADQATLATEASDLVDDALALIRHWAARGESSFQPLAVRLFRYGARLYRLHQPHFLAEFIQENLPLAEPELRAIALDAITAALGDRPAGFLTIGDPAAERHLQVARELETLRTRLAA